MKRLLLALVVVGAVALWRWWTVPPDAAAVLRAHAAPLARVVRDPLPDLGAGVERWRLLDARGDTTLALWRPAPRGARDPWTVVMLGGIGTGERAALLLPDDLPVHVLAVEWPWHGPRRMRPLELARAAPALRRALFRTPGALALGLEAAARAPETDSARVALLGASLGVPPSIAALSLTHRARALVLLDGFAGLEPALRHGLSREMRRRRWAAGPLAALGARLLDPLEPERHAAALHLPALVMNAERDERIPHECVERLRALMPDASVRGRDDTHVLPERRALIGDLAHQAAAWLDSLPAR